MNLSLTYLSKGKSSKKMYAPTQIRKLLQNSAQSARFFKLAQTQPYQNMNRPRLTPQKRTKIKEKLQFDQEVKIMTKNREKQGDLFVKYGINPFMNLSEISQQKIQIQNVKKEGFNQQKTKQLPRQSNFDNTIIIDALWTDRKIQKNETLKNRRDEIKRYSNQISKSVSKLKQPQTLTTQTNSKIYQKRQEKEFTIDEIVKMEDENYFIKKQSEINIFKIMKGNRKNILSNEILVKHHFCTDSTTDKKEKFAVPTYRNISIVGRQFATGRFKGSADKRAQILKSSQMLVSSNAMTIEDLISVAAGRITPDLAFSIINEAGLRRNKPSFEEKSQEIELEDLYNENTNQKMMNFTINHQETHQIQHYLGLQNTLNQQRFSKRCEYFHTNIVNELNRRQKLCKNAVYDKELHKTCNNQIDIEYDGLIQIDHRMSKIEKDRMIRINKMSKTRNDTIKVRQLLKSLIIKNKSDREVNSILKQRKIR